MAFEKEGDEYRYTRWNAHTDVTGVSIAMPPDFLLTEGPDFPSRLRVDTGSTGFFAGKEFRFFYEFNIASGQSAWVKVVTGVDSTLKLQSIEVDEGGVRFRAWRNATDVGPWVAPASPLSGFFNSNPAAQLEYGYVVQTAVSIGGNGAATTGSATVAEISRVATSGSTAQRSTVGQNSISERGILAATYHLQLENIAGSGAARGVYNFILEERG